MRVGRGSAALLSLAAAFATPAAAEVTAHSQQGFATHASADIAAPPARVWAALIEPDFWWSKDHSWFGPEGRFVLTPAAGGCFCEVLTNEDLQGVASAEHMRVLYVAPGKELRMRGSLGPLQAEALTGVLTISLAPEGEGTRVIWQYVVGGFARFPLEAVAPAVDHVMSEQLSRFESFVETGAPPSH